MNTLALFLFGIAMSFAGFLLFYIKLIDDRINMGIAKILYSLPLFFGGLYLAAWTISYGVGWAAPETTVDWSAVFPLRP